MIKSVSPLAKNIFILIKFIPKKNGKKKFLTHGQKKFKTRRVRKNFNMREKNLLMDIFFKEEFFEKEACDITCKG